MSARLLAIGTALPACRITQADAARLAEEIRPQEPDVARVVPVLYRRTGVAHRASVLLEPRDAPGPAQRFFASARSPEDRGPGTGARLDRYAAEAPGLVLRAARQALVASGTPAWTITHLVTASCTGFGAPGVDASLVAALELRQTVERTNVGFMGCHGAINALRVARGFAECDPGARVLVCAVELCSLHFQYTQDPEQMVANALFADGAAAVVIAGGAPEPTDMARIGATGSCLVPGSTDAMTWRIGDHGFEMTLSARVPSLLESHLRTWTGAWLDAQGVAIRDVGAWAIHPGGPRILTAAGTCLGLSDEALSHSRRVLAGHGNMSSPTVLFILDELRRAAPAAPKPWVGMAFGPGLTIEAMLLT